MFLSYVAGVDRRDDRPCIWVPVWGYGTHAVLESAGVTSRDDASILNAALTQGLIDAGAIKCPNVYIAMSRAPRHVFLPGVDLETAYADDVVVTKTDAAGRPVSSASAPWMVATMLEYAQIVPGDRCLEIGTGTGYNAWIMRHIAGRDGSVVSVEIDGEVSARAAENLVAADSHDVELVVGDGARGHLEGAPYDKIIVTAGSWDVPPAWVDQLADGGRLVVPLRWRGQTRCLALRRDGDVLVSENMCLCGFIPMRNDDGEKRIMLNESGLTLVYDADQDIDAEALIGAHRGEAYEIWTGCHVRGEEPLDTLWLHIIMVEQGACMILAPGQMNRVVLAERGSMAMLDARVVPGDEGMCLELGVLGYGAEGEKLAERLAAHFGQWGRDRTRVPEVRVYPAGSEAVRPLGRCIEKVFTCLVLFEESDQMLSVRGR